MTFGSDGITSACEEEVRRRRASAAKLAERAGSAAKLAERAGSGGIFGEDACADARGARVEEDGPRTRCATWDDVKVMMIADLRTRCRERGINPAGSREALAERLWEALSNGECALEVEDKPKGGVSNATMNNNYTRSSGQNAGNFLTARATSRVLRDPGGGSSFIFGGESPPKRSGNGEGDRTSRGGSPKAQARASHIAAMAGSDIFGAPQMRSSRISAAKLAEQRGNNVFDQTLPPTKPIPAHRQAALRQIQGVDIFDQNLPQVRRQRCGKSQTPGGSSSINFEGMFLPASDDEGDAPDDDEDEEPDEGETRNVPVVEEPEET